MSWQKGQAFYPSSSALTYASVRNDDVESAAQIILSARGSREKALEFVRKVFLGLSEKEGGVAAVAENAEDDWDGAVRNGPPYVSPIDQAMAQASLNTFNHNKFLVLEQRKRIIPRPLQHLNLVHDDLDKKQVTLALLIPGEVHIVGHVIGKGGIEIERIQQQRDVVVKIDQNILGNKERTVKIFGCLAEATMAQRLISLRIQEKLLMQWSQMEFLKIIVPNEFVRHLIGKSGQNVWKIQNESGARIQIDATMEVGAIGRVVSIFGPERCRTYAQYLIMRQLAEDKSILAFKLKNYGVVPNTREMGDAYEFHDYI